MATFVNPQVVFTGTAEDDQILFDTAPTTGTSGDAGEGVDRVTVNFTSSGPLSFHARDLSGTGKFSGGFSLGPFGPTVTYENVEEVFYTGGSYDDFFELDLGPATAGLMVQMDGGDGVDRLSIDLTQISAGISFQVSGGAISSSFGTFANIEQFEILSGDGNDMIVTEDGDDYIVSGDGEDTIDTGGGNDAVTSQGGGDAVDLGAGYDFWTGIFEDAVEDLEIALGASVSTSNGVNVSGAEVVRVRTGSGNDTFTVTAVSDAELVAGLGFDTLH